MPSTVLREACARGAAPGRKARSPEKAGVGGSIPSLATTYLVLTCLVDSSLLSGLFCRQRKAWFSRDVVKNPAAQILTQRRSVFKAMTGAAARDPYVFKIRMTVDEKVAVPRVFVLAYPSLDNRRMLQGGDVLAQVGAQVLDGRLCDATHSGM